jgi:Ca2+-binding EF-hand superfamily protein
VASNASAFVGVIRAKPLSRLVVTRARRQQDQLLAYFLQREKLRVAFDQIDLDRSGSIDSSELGTLFEALEIPADKLAAIMASLDVDGILSFFKKLKK